MRFEFEPKEFYLDNLQFGKNKIAITKKFTIKIEWLIIKYKLKVRSSLKPEKQIVERMNYATAIENKRKSSQPEISLKFLGSRVRIGNKYFPYHQE